MSEITIKTCTIIDLLNAPNLGALLREYAAECSNPAIGDGQAQMDTYKALAESGIASAVGAYCHDELQGFITIIRSDLPHYGQRVGMSESFFVTKSARKNGTGLKLIKAAEKAAFDAGCKAFFISAPFGSTLEQFIPSAGYKQSNSVFCKGLV